MTRKHRLIFYVLVAIALPVLGYAIAHGLVLLFPMSEQVPVMQGLFVLLLIVGLLLVPYWILKLGVHAASEANPTEKELRLKDVPKDKEQLNQPKS